MDFSAQEKLAENTEGGHLFFEENDVFEIYEYGK